MGDFWGPDEIEFLLDLALAFVTGAIIGAEREWKRKPAGLSTQMLVIGASMTFTFLSKHIPNSDPTRIASQIVSGVGFLGAGIILRSEASRKVTNLTTAASIWYASSIGMAIGFNFHAIALIASLYAVIISGIPKINPHNADEAIESDHGEKGKNQEDHSSTAS